MTDAVADTIGNRATFTLKAGTIVKVNGVRACLVNDTPIQTNASDYGLMQEAREAQEPEDRSDR